MFTSFHVLTGHLYTLFEKNVYSDLWPFLKLRLFVMLSCKGHLYVLDTDSLLDK